MDKQQEPRLRFKVFTEVWQEKVLGEILSVRNEFVDSSLYDLDVELENLISNSGILVGDTSVRTQTTSSFRKGDILFGRLRPYLNKWWLAEKDGVKSGEIWALETSSKYSNSFAYLLVQSRKFLETANVTSGTKMPRADWRSLAAITFNSPSKLEQTHLGLFFRRLDSQIAESHAALEKSRQLKKAMLAKMFPANGEKIPKIRFKGFEGEWKEKSLGELAEQIKSYPLSRNVETLENTGFKYIHYGDIHRGIADIIYSDKVLPNIQAGNFELLKRGDLIIADVSEDYEGVGAACVIDCPLEYKVVSGLHTIAIRPNQTSPLFLYYLLKTQEFKQYGRLIGTGTKVVGITASKFLSFQTHIPTVLEQTAIANFFRQLDENIALQAAEMEKLNQLKKGLLAAMLV